MIIENGFFNRMKKLQVIRMLGSGMDLGEFNEYAYEICFLLIQNIFKREITENTNRTRTDMLLITERIIDDMNLKCSKDIVERIVDGTLWYREPSRQDSFNSRIYNEATRDKAEFAFRYFKVDRENSHWETGGSTVYALSEESQEMIFITREILEEFGFDLEQFYTLQLIKTGNFTKARNSIDNLIARVRVLINREKDYKKDIIRDPQNIFFDRNVRGRKSEDEIRTQFADEQKVFQNMFAWRSRYDSLPEERKKEAEIMFENLERARLLHDSLAKHVTENLALELEIRVKYPESFWNITHFSFKKDIWQNNIIKNGVKNVEDLENLLYPLFSPEIEFIYPLEWAWAEQSVKSKRNDKRVTKIEEEENWEFGQINWDLIVYLYTYVFEALIDRGEFSILELDNLDEQHKLLWLSQSENIDLFMMFVISETVLDVNYTGEDDRLKLFKLLCEKDSKFKNLKNKKILSRLEVEKENLNWNELSISAYTIYIEE